MDNGHSPLVHVAITHHHKIVVIAHNFRVSGASSLCMHTLMEHLLLGNFQLNTANKEFPRPSQFFNVARCSSSVARSRRFSVTFQLMITAPSGSQTHGDEQHDQCSLHVA